jgi:hypothetical protein
MIITRRRRIGMMRRRILALTTLGLLIGALAWSVANRAAHFSRNHSRQPARADLRTDDSAARRRAIRLAIRKPIGPTDVPHVKHIASLVRAVAPRQSPEYAWMVASNIVQSARENGVSPYIVSATAVVESEFSMQAGPCVGVMQMNPATVAEVYSRSDRDVNGLEDNIWMGANFLAINYRSRLASRGGSDEYRMRHMWGRYNGSGPKSLYVKRALRVLRRIKEGNSVSWKRTIKTTGTLWGDKPLKPETVK